MNQDKIWSHFQVNLPGSFDLAFPRLAHLAKHLKPGMLVLNIGIGNGGFEKLALSRGARIISFDPDPSSLARHGNSAHSVAGLIEKLPFAAGTFDAVVASEVLEHLNGSQLDLGLVEIHRVLRGHGYFLGTVPANERLEEGVVLCPHCGVQFHRWGHLQSFSRPSLQSRLEAVFQETTISTHAFMSKSGMSLPLTVIGYIRNFLVRTGILTREQKFVFQAFKRT
jgi:SAM-dependent methyltransferase